MKGAALDLNALVTAGGDDRGLMPAKAEVKAKSVKQKVGSAAKDNTPKHPSAEDVILMGDGGGHQDFLSAIPEWIKKICRSVAISRRPVLASVGSRISVLRGRPAKPCLRTSIFRAVLPYTRDLG
jgi:hypothetical protein